MTASPTRVIIALLIFVAALVAYGMWYRSVTIVSARTVDLAAQIETKTATQKRIAAIRAALDELANDEARVNQYFVSPDTVVSFLEELQAHGADTGASVDVLSVSAGTATTQPTLQISLVIDGSFNAVMQTIGRIEYAPYHVSVSSLALNLAKASPSAEAQAEDTWSATMQIAVGSLPSEGAASPSTKTP